MNMKKFDRVLNILLVVAVTLFVADYFFLRETPGSFDERTNAFAPVKLGETRVQPEPAAVSPPASTSNSSAATVTTNATGGPELSEPAPFTALTWEQLEAEVAGDTPTLVVVFTSWCPFCKKLMPEITSLANEQKEKLNLVAISIDEDPNAIRSFISTLPSLPPFPVYVHASDNERSLVQAFLYKNKINFTGGIPFMAIFHQGKAVQQIGGFVEKSVLTQMLGRIEEQKNPVNTY